MRHKLQRFSYDANLNKWLWFVAETLVSAFVGALIAFVFGSHYWAALLTFAILMLFLVLLAAVLIAFENRVSILSIMNQGLRDGKYEDVIKFGSAMRGTLFTSNKNADIVILGGKIDAAAAQIESAHYNNSKGEYLVTVDGAPKTITQIRIGLKIDDLGWSMHLCKRTEEAITNILEGMKSARHKASSLARSDPQRRDGISPLVQLILRGYRHLSGIYYEDVSQHWRASFIETVTKLVMSTPASLAQPGVCDSHSGPPNGTTCRVFCSATYEAKVACARKNILARYFRDDWEGDPGATRQAPGIQDSLDGMEGDLLSGAEIEEDKVLYRLLPRSTRTQIAREQCYAWSRNIVKKVQNGMHRQGENDFLSDEEFSSLVAEARAFSQVYYYGTDAVPADDDFDRVLRQTVVGKSELRYASLMAEIELVKLLLPAPDGRPRDTNAGANLRIERLINNLRATREICRDKRADLYVRASVHLMTAYHLQYNLDHRHTPSQVVNTTPAARQSILENCRTTVKELYRDIMRYQHRSDDDLDQRYRLIMEDLSFARKELKMKYRLTTQPADDTLAAAFLTIDASRYQSHRVGEHVAAAVHNFDSEDVDNLKTKWERL